MISNKNLKNKVERKNVNKLKVLTVAGLSSAALTFASFVNVSAVTTVYPTSPTSTSTAGGNISGQPGKFRITRKVTGVPNPVTNTFTYTVTADSGNPGTISGSLSSPFTIEMNDNAVSGGVSTKTADIDFSGLSFSELGDYSFTVRETASSDATNYPRDTKEYKIYVSVRNQLDGNGVPTGTYEGIISQMTDGADGKADAAGAHAFTSQVARTYIQASQIVTGNMAKKTDCFKYQIIIPANSPVVLSGDKYSVSTTSTCTGNPADVTVGGSSNYIYMKHGDTVTIGGGATSQIPIGVSYQIKLTDAQGYQTTYYDGAARSDLTMPSKTTVAQTASTFNTQNKTEIRNDKYADPNTGILMNLWPFVLLVVLAGTGTIVVVNKTKKNKA